MLSTRVYCLAQHVHALHTPFMTLCVQVGAAAASKDPSLLMAAKHSLAVALLVFSMTERAGFNQLPDYLAELDSRRCILVATRADHVQSGAVTMVRC